MQNTTHWKPYKRDFAHSYALGPFVCAELVRHRPEALRAVYVHTDGLENEGARALLAHAQSAGLENDVQARIFQRLAPKGNVYALGVFSKWEDALQERPHIVLVNPSDSGNVGTILRTALGFGVRDVALIRPCVDVFDPRTVRASMGALFAQRTQLFDSFEAYRARYPDHALFPFALDGGRPLASVQPPALWSLVFGNEASGLPAEIRTQGASVYIPQSEFVDSLNLAIAAGIGLYHFTR